MKCDKPRLSPFWPLRCTNKYGKKGNFQKCNIHILQYDAQPTHEKGRFVLKIRKAKISGLRV